MWKHVIIILEKMGSEAISLPNSITESIPVIPKFLDEFYKLDEFY